MQMFNISTKNINKKMNEMKEYIVSLSYKFTFKVVQALGY
jgi:hypothetical protein